jgi:adenosylcobinamide-GDP ribazoletransferase
MTAGAAVDDKSIGEQVRDVGRGASRVMTLSVCFCRQPLYRRMRRSTAASRSPVHFRHLFDTGILMSPLLRDWLDDLGAAAAFLTRVPVPQREAPFNLARAYRAFPLVGAVIGAAIGMVDVVLLRIGVPPIAAAALALGAAALLTGALHEDGLADVADGFGGGRDKAAKLEVMRDSRLGTYGVLVLLTAFVAKVGALAALPRGHVILSLMATQALARAPLAVMAGTMLYAREGLAASVGRPDRSTCIAAVLVAVVVALLALPVGTALVAMMVTAGSAACFAMIAQRQIGGQTGDVLGAAEQVCEIAVLVLLAARL